MPALHTSRAAREQELYIYMLRWLVSLQLRRLLLPLRTNHRRRPASRGTRRPEVARRLLPVRRLRPRARRPRLPADRRRARLLQPPAVRRSTTTTTASGGRR